MLHVSSYEKQRGREEEWNNDIHKEHIIFITTGITEVIKGRVKDLAKYTNLLCGRELDEKINTTLMSIF